MTTRAPVKPAREAPAHPQDKPRSEAAQDRLAAALRENLKRRKAQKKARGDSKAGEAKDRRGAGGEGPAT